MGFYPFFYKRDRFLKSQLGFTLIEILVVMVIIASVMGLAVSMFSNTAADALEETASQLSGTIRYVYNEAAVQNKYYRLVVDLGGVGSEGQSFSVEVSDQPFKIVSSEEGEPDASLSDTPPEPSEDSLSPEEEPNSEEVQKTENSPSSQGFAQVSTYLLKPLQISKKIKIKDVTVAHQKTKIEQGKTAIYFFPNGWVEKAVINLSDEKEEQFYSLETFSASGRTKIRTKYFDLQMGEVLP